MGRLLRSNVVRGDSVGFGRWWRGYEDIFSRFV